MSHTCYICLDDHENEQVARPCRCTTPVHPSCLAAWLCRVPLADSATCSVCKAPLDLRVFEIDGAKEDSRCRACLDEGGIRLCACPGIFGHMHRQCFETFRLESGFRTPRCPICGTKYMIPLIDRVSWISKAILQWFRQIIGWILLWGALFALFIIVMLTT